MTLCAHINSVVKIFRNYIWISVLLAIALAFYIKVQAWRCADNVFEWLYKTSALMFDAQQLTTWCKSLIVKRASTNIATYNQLSNTYSLYWADVVLFMVCVKAKTKSISSYRISWAWTSAMHCSYAMNENVKHPKQYPNKFVKLSDNYT